MSTAQAYLKKIRAERRKKDKALGLTKSNTLRNTNVSSDDLINQNKPVWSAVAYQQEMAKKFLPTKAHRRRRIAQKSRREDLNLAQKLGIAEKREPTLKETDWNLVKDTAMKRKHHHAPCSICMEPFGNRKQVILNCSHVFHHTCLRSYERYITKNTSRKRAEDRECPMCRKKDYQKSTNVHDGKVVARDQAALTIQCAYRRHLACKKFQDLYFKANPNAKRAFLSRKLSKFGDHLARKQQQKEDFLDQFLSSLDASVAKSRILMFDDSDWLPILQSAKQKYKSTLAEEGEVCCPICMQHADQQVTVTSCGHIFHHTCLCSFESFQPPSQTVHPCPVCRQNYSRRPFAVPIVPKARNISPSLLQDLV